MHNFVIIVPTILRKYIAKVPTQQILFSYFQKIAHECSGEVYCTSTPRCSSVDTLFAVEINLRGLIMKELLERLFGLGMTLPDARKFDWGVIIRLILDGISSDELLQAKTDLQEFVGQTVELQGISYVLNFRPEGTEYKGKDGFRAMTKVDEYSLRSVKQYTSFEDCLSAMD